MGTTYCTSVVLLNESCVYVSYSIVCVLRRYHFKCTYNWHKNIIICLFVNMPFNHQHRTSMPLFVKRIMCHQIYVNLCMKEHVHVLKFFTTAGVSSWVQCVQSKHILRMLMYSVSLIV